MTTTEGRLAARQCVQDRMSDLRMNLADLARESGVDVKTIRSFLGGERWPQKKSRAAMSVGLSWPSTFIDRIADGTLDPDVALGHVLIDGKHAPAPSAADGVALRLNGIDRQIDALWDRVDALEHQLQQLGGDGDADDTTGGAAPNQTPEPGPADQPGRKTQPDYSLGARNTGRRPRNVEDDDLAPDPEGPEEDA